MLLLNMSGLLPEVEKYLEDSFLLGEYGEPVQGIAQKLDLTSLSEWAMRMSRLGSIPCSLFLIKIAGWSF